MIRINKRSFKSEIQAFVLFEVMVSIIILGIALGTSLRAFTYSIMSLKKVQITTTGILLADQLLSELQLFPPKEGEFEGGFGELSPRYFFVISIEKETVEYESVEFEGDIDEFDPIWRIRFSLYYDESESKTIKVIDGESYFFMNEMFSLQTKQDLQIF